MEKSYKIYKISSNDECYIGITTQKYLCQRIHKSHPAFVLYNFNKNDYQVELLEEGKGTKQYYFSREFYYIEKNKCCNKRNGCKYFDKESRKQYYRERYKNNKDKWVKRGKERYENNKEKISEYRRRPEIVEKSNIVRRIHRQYVLTWGGDERTNNNLHKIDTSLFE